MPRQQPKDPAVDERGFVDLDLAMKQNREDPWFTKKREPKMRRLEKWEKSKGAKDYDRTDLTTRLRSAIHDANRAEREPLRLPTSVDRPEQKKLGL